MKFSSARIVLSIRLSSRVNSGGAMSAVSRNRYQFTSWVFLPVFAKLTSSGASPVFGSTVKDASGTTERYSTSVLVHEKPNMSIIFTENMMFSGAVAAVGVHSGRW